MTKLNTILFSKQKGYIKILPLMFKSKYFVYGTGVLTEDIGGIFLYKIFSSIKRMIFRVRYSKVSPLPDVNFTEV